MNLQTSCVTCGAAVAGRYCSACGEQAAHEHGYSIRHLVEELLENVAHLDGRVLRSVRSLLTAPGLLATDFLRGRRKPYVGPLHLFVMANLVYFLLQPFSAFVPFTTTLEVQTTGFAWSGLARRMVASRMGGEAATAEAFRRTFDETAHLQGKSLVIIMVPMFAVLVWGLYRTGRPFFLEHLVFSFYLFAFWLLWMGVTTVLLTHVITAAVHHGYRPGSRLIERGSSVVALAPFAIYLYLASRRAYGGPRRATLLKTAALSGWLFAVLQAYRFILLFTTFYAT